MKKKTKVIASAVATIALCASLSVGGTFALFTSESKVNVAISSGTVDVKATVADLQAYSGSWNAETSEYDLVISTSEYSEAAGSGYYFANGGFASVSTAANTVTLNRITPMDKVSFNIVINNDSNVAVQYRTVIKVTEDDGLFGGLNVKIGAEEQVYGGTTTYSHWNALEAGSSDIIVPVSIELPQSAGNEYQGKSCVLSYSVEAVQGNAYVFDGEAWIIRDGRRIETDTLADALDLAQEYDVIRLARPGTYAPFTVSTKGVTVEGIIGATKADSTVFLTTADKNVQLFADNVTLKNAWVEVGAEQTGITGWSHKGAIDAIIRSGSGTYAKDITLDGCYFNGNNYENRAFIYCGSKISVKNCTFENFKYCAFDSMDDNNTPEKIEIIGNTFKGLNVAYDIYAGKGYTGTEKNLIVKNNVSDNGAIVRIWDYAQYVRPTEGSAFNAEVTGNENISLYLTHFDSLYVTPIVTDETDIVYQMEVALPDVAAGTYTVLNADGSEITTFGDHKTTRVHNGNTVVYALRAGDYMLKNDAHTYTFTVVDHTAGVLGSGYTAEITGIVANSANLQAYIDGEFGSIDGKTIVLESGDYDKIELGRATKFAGSNTQYYIGNVAEENEKTFDEFYAIKTSGSWSASANYVRNINDVTFKAADGATVNVDGLIASSGHYYGTVYDYVLDKAYTSGSAYYLTHKFSNIAFEGINFTAKTEISTSSATTVIDGVKFKNCSFETGDIATANGQGLRYYNESNNGNVKNLTVENCTFKNCYQSIYTQKINGITVTGCSFDTTGHNAIAIQSGSEAINHKAVVITGNTFANIGDRIIRFGDVGADTQITIRDNTATDSGDDSGEVMKAQSLAEGVTYDIGDNDWGEGKTVSNPELQDA